VGVEGRLAGDDQVCAGLDRLPEHVQGGQRRGGNARHHGGRIASLERIAAVRLPGGAKLFLDAIDDFLRGDRSAAGNRPQRQRRRHKTAGGKHNKIAS